MEEIQGLMDAHAAFKATLGEADKEYNSIVGLVREVESIVKQFQIPGGLENPYTTLTALVSYYSFYSSISLLQLVYEFRMNVFRIYHFTGPHQEMERR